MLLRHLKHLPTPDSRLPSECAQRPFVARWCATSGPRAQRLRVFGKPGVAEADQSAPGIADQTTTSEQTPQVPRLPFAGNSMRVTADAALEHVRQVFQQRKVAASRLRGACPCAACTAQGTRLKEKQCRPAMILQTCQDAAVRLTTTVLT